MTSAAPSSAKPLDLGPPPRLDLARSAVFLDLDGTLAPIQATPSAVGPDAARSDLLDALSRGLGGRLAVVSGRALDDLDRILEGRVIALAGAHGLARRTADGRVSSAAPDRRIDEALRAFRGFAATDDKLLVEDKGPAVALHYRLAPTAKDDCRNLAQDLAARLDLRLREGDQVAEVTMKGPDKGGAVRAFMAEAPFAGHRPVFVGDDLTDEAGFRAAEALGGFGVVVGARRPTAAAWSLPDVPATLAWLRRGAGLPQRDTAR